MSGGRTSERSRYPLISILLGGTGRQEGVGGPVLRACPDVQKSAGRPGGSWSTRDLRSETRFWAEIGDFVVKIDEISSMESGKTWGDARYT